jgi:hypothetical protein
MSLLQKAKFINIPVAKTDHKMPYDNTVWCVSQTRLLHFTHDKCACCVFNMYTTQNAIVAFNMCTTQPTCKKRVPCVLTTNAFAPSKLYCAQHSTRARFRQKQQGEVGAHLPRGCIKNE